MPSQCIDQRSQHHFHSLDKRFAVTTAGCVRNGSFKVVNDRQQVLDHALFGKTDRVISIAGCAFLVILEFGGLPQESVIVVFCLDFLVFELFPQSRDFGFQAGLAKLLGSGFPVNIFLSFGAHTSKISSSQHSGNLITMPVSVKFMSGDFP
jgi:hypothetical protein